MKTSIIGKTLLIISSIIIILFSVVGYLFIQIDNKLIEKIRVHNYQNTMKTLDHVQKKQLEISKEKIEQKVSEIAKNSAIFIYNYDQSGLEDSLKIAMNNDGIMAITIWDEVSSEIFLSTFKKDNKIIVSSTLPKFLNNYIKLEEFIISEESGLKENIGKVTLYYDDSAIKTRIKNLKKKSKAEIAEFDISAMKAKRDSDILKGFIAIGFFILLLFFIAYLINKFVNKPLRIFKDGLQSFFDFLSDPKKQVRVINIDTRDEFGQMSSSVNESIQVSIKLHGDISNLMSTMDKNVITSETDNEGIITYVSQAFCNISGYAKEELLGKPHSMIRHPDMPKNTFKDMWKTLNDNRTWEGEVKNICKDRTFYWVYSIISPKCSKSCGSCGYTAVSYDITNKKEVQDLTANLEVKIEERTADLIVAKKEIELAHKHTRDSIEYASLIQGAVISQEKEIQPFFKDSFIYWMPKDTVGGDIWLFNELRHEDECLLMFIDCTGHGVPGAFVTMIVKAIEREIVSNLKKHPEFDISPAIIMAHFNKTMKVLLKQTSKDSKSNAGWDGGIIYYNKRTQILKFAGAETPLFYIDENQEFKTIKGNRYSVGYKKCSMDYEYKETILKVQEGMKFYCTTDGFLDQNGGGKDFPFGKKRFGNIIKENHTKNMDNQKEIFIDTMKEYELLWKRITIEMMI